MFLWKWKFKIFNAIKFVVKNYDIPSINDFSLLPWEPNRLVEMIWRQGSRTFMKFCWFVGKNLDSSNKISITSSTVYIITIIFKVIYFSNRLNNIKTNVFEEIFPVSSFRNSIYNLLEILTQSMIKLFSISRISFLTLIMIY